uniref:Uncharacterized protein n=1 Tax=Coptotermes formosanus TaxID=36987 RepID=R4V338_COPFO|nr:hypothetical protein [Coptotermes formosanus]
MSIFNGNVFPAFHFGLDRLVCIIAAFKIFCLNDFINHFLPCSTTFADSMSFLLLPYSFELVNHYENAIKLVLQNFHFSTAELSHLSDSVLFDLFSLSDLRLNDENQIFRFVLQLIEESIFRVFLAKYANSHLFHLSIFENFSN